MQLIWIFASLADSSELKICVIAQNHSQGSVDKNDTTSKPTFLYNLCGFSQICLKYWHKTEKCLNINIPCNVSGVNKITKLVDCVYLLQLC